MDLTQFWMDKVFTMASSLPAVAHAQERAFYDRFTWAIPGKVWELGCSHTLEDLGYSGAGTKMAQLSRDYTNHEDIEAAKKAFHVREQQAVTSWAISAIGATKRNAQGHCIRNILINYYHPKVALEKKGVLAVHIVYRTTELLRKFGADLLFLRDKLIPEILEGNPWGYKHPDTVNIYFGNCFFSALFIPILYQYVDPINFLKEVKKFQGNSLFYRRCLYRTKTMLTQGEEYYKFASRRNMARFAEKLIQEGKIDKQELTRFLEKEEI